MDQFQRKNDPLRGNDNDNYNSDDEDDDDLAFFEQQKRIKIIKDNNINVGGMYSDEESNQMNSKNSKKQSKAQTQFKKFYGFHEGQAKKQDEKNQKNSQPQQITKEQLQAKKLRAFNAAKYFQRIRLAYLKKIYNRSRELYSISSNKHPQYENNERQFSLFLSLLPPQLLKQCALIRRNSPFTVDDGYVLQIYRRAFKEKNLDQYGESKVQGNSHKLTKTQLMLRFAQFLNVEIKKIDYFNIHNFVDESFYNLNFQKYERGRKKSKKTNKFQDQIKNKIQRKIQQQQLQQSEDFVDLNDFSFDTVNKNLTKTQSQLSQECKQLKKRSKKNQQIKKHFHDETYQIFSHLENRWKLFIAIEDHFEEVEVEWFKENVLNGLPIIGFHSVEVLRMGVEYEELTDLRKMDRVVVKDMAMFFCDSWKRFTLRKKRVGIKPFMGKIFRFAHYQKPFDVLSKPQAFQLQHTVQQTRKTLIQKQMPKSKDEFNLSDYFMTKSRVGKYHILSPIALPVCEEAEYNEQKIYWKDDLIPVCSRMGWIDFSRMVIDGAQAVKKTENRNKKPIQLYTYQQTKPYALPIDPSGNFILDPQHNSIYIPPELQVPQQTCIIPQKVSYVCNRYKMRFAKLVQGFKPAGGMRVIPNEIGFIVYQKDREEILRLHHERQELLNRNKESRYDEKLEKMWREVLKYVKLIDRMGGEVRN